MALKPKKLELLAPAGNLGKLNTALAYGADAVYLGSAEFSLRVRINSFNLNKIKQAVKLAHDQGKKVYVTINIFAQERHLRKIPKFVTELKKLKVDGLIISDPGILNLVKQNWPGAEIHLSTQANCLNSEAAKFWYQVGVKRIILGRETKLKDIKAIKKKVPQIELEYFVHGAMCMAYSGRCFLSQHFLDRSANLGDCVQPCRWKYYISEEKRLNEPLELVEDDKGSYILNSKDLCLIEYLDQLQQAGVSSFKIEGRNKSVYYLANVCGIYRQAITALRTNRQNYLSQVKFFKQELEQKLVNRGYTTGFLTGQVGDQNTKTSQLRSDWEFCGQVIESGEDNWIKVKVHNSLKIGDVVEIVKPAYNISKLKIKKIINAGNQQEMPEAHGGGSKDIVLLEVDQIIPKFSVLRRQI